MKLPSTKNLMNSEQKKLLFSNGKPEKFPVCLGRFLAYLENKNIKVESEKTSEVNRDVVQRKLYQ